MQPDPDEIHAGCTRLVVPIADGRRREARVIADAKRELEKRLGPSPTFEQRQLAEQILRVRFELAVIDRKRAATGVLGDFDSEMRVRLENMLARALRRLERLTPEAGPKGTSTLAALARRHGARVGEAA